MSDRETGSTWSHYTGEALDGPMKGRRLDFVRVERGTLAELSEGRTGVQTVERTQLHWKKKPMVVGPRAQQGDLRQDFAKTLDGATPRSDLPPHTHGLGVLAGAEQRFYSLERLYTDGLVSDILGGVPVVVMIHDGSSTAAAYSRCVDGTTLGLASVEHDGETAMKDTEGTVWNARGEAVAGPRKGAHLTSLRAMITDWYGWAAFHPKTTVADPPAAAP